MTKLQNHGFDNGKMWAIEPNDEYNAFRYDGDKIKL